MTVNLTARYAHGEWTALVTEHGTALLDPRIPTGQVEQVWTALSEGRGVSGCLEVLAADGFANLPSFALVQHGADELRVLVRGEVEVRAGESAVGAAGIATWRESLLPGQQYQVQVIGDGAAHQEWPISGGVVLASRVEWLGSGDGSPGAAGAAAVAEDGDGSGDEGGDDGDGDPEPAAEGEPAEPVAESETRAEPESADGEALGDDDLAGAGGADADHDDDASAGAARGLGVAAPVAADAVAGQGSGGDLESGLPTGDEPADPPVPEGEAAEDEDPDEAADEGEAVDSELDVPGAGASDRDDADELDAAADDSAESGDSAESDVLDGADDLELNVSAEADGLEESVGEHASAGTPDEPSEEAVAGELESEASDEALAVDAHVGEERAPDDQGAPADATTEVSAHTAEEESAPSPEELTGATESDAAADAPTLSSSGSDIIDSLPWAVSASDREAARAVQEQAAGEPPATPTFDEPATPTFDEPAAETQAATEVPAPADTVNDELPEQTVVSRPGAEDPSVPAAPAQPAEPSDAGAESADAGADNVISFDSLMAQQVPQPPPQEYPQQAGGGFGTPASAEPAAQPYPANAAPYGPGAAFGAPAVQQQTPPPWAPPAEAAQPHLAAPGHGDLDIEGDHDGETIMVSQLPTGNGGGAAPGTGESDLHDEPHATPQPSIHLALSTGAHVPLDRPVLIGRAPESARFNAGVQPRLVTVASPEQDISRTHAEVRAEGGHAVVTDLNSTNGTVVVQPGSPPRRLHPGEGASVTAGTVVDLGDGITLTVQTTTQEAG